MHHDLLARLRDAGSLTYTATVPPSVLFAARVDGRRGYRSGAVAWSMSCPLVEPVSRRRIRGKDISGESDPKCGHKRANLIVWQRLAIEVPRMR